MSNPKAILDSTEAIIATQQNIMWYEKKIKAFSGTLYVTDKRVIFDMYKQNIPGAFMRKVFKKNMHVDTGGVMVDVPRTAIDKVERTTFGKVEFLNVYEKGREKPHKFLVEKYDEWEKALAN